MFQSQYAQLLLMYAISPIHAGAGSAVGAIDLPIQRERHTGRPIIQASGVKGALRDACEQVILKDAPDASVEERRAALAKHKELNAVFGREDSNNAQAGALSTSDAKVLFFPVRSSHAPFLYVTCPAVLRQLHSDCKAAGISGTESLLKIEVVTEQGIEMSGPLTQEASQEVVLEDLRVTLQSAGDPEGLTFLRKLVGHYTDISILDHAIIISDADFQYLVETTCPVQTRIALGPNGTTSEKGGNLWYQELLPADTLLYSLSFLSAERSAREDALKVGLLQAWFKETLPTHLQLGGDASLGRGFCELKWTGMS
jgi:CRISPR-associated protein Cmr4